ncbi:MAG TPA: VIT1/CCC1 transporter family protein, partial [Gemmataceae bacterium]|nr:VIT1/CCC1 transporter family protein [Gemmataceae bacterium]
MTSAENQQDSAPGLPRDQQPSVVRNVRHRAVPDRARAGLSRPYRGEAHGHHHRDVSGGWLRPAVFGAMDGLVTNVSLISGVGGGGVRGHTILLTGLAGLAAG